MVPAIVTGVGEREQAAPVGVAIVQVRLTAPVSPPPGVTVIVLVPDVAVGKVIEIGVAARKRLGTPTANEMATVPVTFPVRASAPLIVTV